MKYKTRKKAVLLLADGTIFHGKAIGNEGTAFGEVCFNTGMTGYQEIFTDPSYFGQLMVTTNPHIGNYGINADEMESDSIKIAGFICKNFSYNYSRVDAEGSLEDFFNTHNLFAISDVDTRALVSYIREFYDGTWQLSNPPILSMARVSLLLRRVSSLFELVTITGYGFFGLHFVCLTKACSIVSFFMLSML